MQLWLLCCFLLFIMLQGYDWLSHQAWFGAPALTLPWVVLGGIGLAIASNRHNWQPWRTSAPQGNREGESAIAPAPLPTDPAPQIPRQPSAAPPLGSAKTGQPASISFDIGQAKARSRS
ncbi:MAG TPA: hypothetical protein V6D02_13690 [Candidatus Obscuribacterales bacterium]